MMLRTPHVSLVTGASSGIGAATATELAARGSWIAIHYHRDVKGAARVQSEIEKIGGRAFLVKANLQSRDEASNLVGEVLSHFGRIDVLINNAGSMVGRQLLTEITEEFWREVIDTNLSSVLWTTQAVVPGMIKRGAGVVVNVASVAARTGGSPGTLAYAASKAAVLCMTKSMAKELVQAGIRVNAVNPGVIATPFHERFTGNERFQSLISIIPQGRPGTAEEVAQVIAFLASPAASHIVGECVEINGGMWMD